MNSAAAGPERAVDSMLAPLGLTAFAHARALDGADEAGVRAGEPVVLASVFKLPVLVTLARQAAAGTVDLTERVRVPAGGRCPRPTGLSVMLDEVRRILGLQVRPHRLRAGFPSPVKVSGKTGTLPFVRNEAGVVEFPGQSAYAVAVSLRSPSPDTLNPDGDWAIGTVAALLVERLRQGEEHAHHAGTAGAETAGQAPLAQRSHLGRAR